MTTRTIASFPISGGATINVTELADPEIPNSYLVHQANGEGPLTAWPTVAAALTHALTACGWGLTVVDTYVDDATLDLLTYRTDARGTLIREVTR